MAPRRITKKPFGWLVQDFGLYPRAKVDDDNVRALLRAHEAGEEIAPIIADARTGRIADGFHRYEMHKRLGIKPGDAVEVELRDYESEEEIFVDAVRLNAAHGKRLSSYDIATTVVRADQLRIGKDTIAEALHLTPHRLEEMTRDRYSIGSVGRSQILKRTIRHLADTELTPEAIEANQKLGGMSQRFYVEQVLALLHGGVIDWDDDKLVSDLRALATALAGVLDEINARTVRMA